MPQCHVWRWYSPQITSYIHIRQIQSVWDIGMLSQRHMVSPLYRFTGQVAPRFGKSGSLEEWEWCHNVMVEADIHLRLIHTSIEDIYKVFEPLVCCLKGIWLHPYTNTLAKLSPDLWSQCHNIIFWDWYLPQIASYIHIRHIQSVWAIGMLSQGHMGAPLFRYTGQVAPRFGDSGSLEDWKWCHIVMVEADIHFRPLHTSILDIYKVFEPLVCCLKGIWVHAYSVTLAGWPQIWGLMITCVVKMMP